jgi:hypothetical protein
MKASLLFPFLDPVGISLMNRTGNKGIALPA